MKRRNVFKSALIGLSGLLFTPGLKAKNINNPGEETGENLFDTIKSRRSVRKFKSDPVPEEHIRKILDAARMAPTAGNQQPWKFLVVRDRKKLDELKNVCIDRSVQFYKGSEQFDENKLDEVVEKTTGYYRDYLSAPVYIVILTDNSSRYPTYNHADGPLAAGYLMLAARALGYGTVFCTDSINEEITREVFKIPENYKRVCITPIGIPVEWPETPEKNDLESFIAYEDID